MVQFEYYSIRPDTSATCTNGWTSYSSSRGRGDVNWPAPTRLKKKEYLKEISSELKAIADEQEEDRLKNLPTFDPEDLDI